MSVEGIYWNEFTLRINKHFLATPKDKYYNVLLDTLVKDTNQRGKPLSNQNIQKAVSDVIE